MCELLGMQRECADWGSVEPSWDSCQKVRAGVATSRLCGVYRRMHRVCVERVLLLQAS